MKTKSYIVLGVASILLATTGVRATTVRRLPLAELTKLSVLIIQGTVVDNQVVFDQGPIGPVNVRTLTTVAVDRTFKGKAEATVTVVGFGGVVGGLSFNWPGVPRFNVGEEAILFLERLPTGEITVVGLEQGRMTIGNKPGLGKVVTRSFAGLNFQGRATSIRAPAPKRLAEVVKEIEDVVESQKSQAERDGAR